MIASIQTGRYLPGKFDPIWYNRNGRIKSGREHTFANQCLAVVHFYKRKITLQRIYLVEGYRCIVRILVGFHSCFCKPDIQERQQRLLKLINYCHTLIVIEFLFSWRFAVVSDLTYNVL